MTNFRKTNIIFGGIAMVAILATTATTISRNTDTSNQEPVSTELQVTESDTDIIIREEDSTVEGIVGTKSSKLSRYRPNPRPTLATNDPDNPPMETPPHQILSPDNIEDVIVFPNGNTFRARSSPRSDEELRNIPYEGRYAGTSESAPEIPQGLTVSETRIFALSDENVYNVYVFSDGTESEAWVVGQGVSLPPNCDENGNVIPLASPQ
jgi:hypothetical protein